MKIEDIIKSVRWCIDEEAINVAEIADVSAYDYEDGSHTDIGLMDNIIRDKIGDALRWVCLYAPSDLLGGSDETVGGQPKATGIMTDFSGAPTSITGTNGGRIVLPTDFVRLARVRVTGWHRAVRSPLEEDSDEYLQLYDQDGAAATADRPQAVLIEKATRELEVWPKGTTAEVTYITSIDAENAIYTETVGTATIEKIALPPRSKSSLIYYIAFLVLSAYGDARSTRMLEIAKLNLGITELK